jgi:saxitoxin biosynthesis operon SxtJ-like protein
MIRAEIQELDTSPRNLRKFGLVVGGVFGLLAVWFWWRGKALYPYVLIPGVFLVVVGLIWPKVLKQVYVIWMSLALVLGLIVSTALLTILFYLVVTPIGLVARLSGKDFLSRKLDPNVNSYWIARDRSIPRRMNDYEQQF